MLARRHRFHGYGSLKRVYQNSKTARGALISLRFATRPPGKPYRVAVVVGRKVHKSAVKRNRIRRRIYEVIRTSEKIPDNYDLIFTVFSDEVAVLPTKELKTAINQLLDKIS